MANRKRGLNRFLLTALLGAALLPFDAPAQATPPTVCETGCEYTTIAAALADADDGDVITIGAGTYAGGIVVGGKRITLRGAGREQTTIQGTPDASVIRVGKAARVTIEAVTITGGGGSEIGPNTIGGGGILAEGVLVVSDSVVRDNTVAKSGKRARLGGGIYIDTARSVRIRDSVIAGNEAPGGAGVFVRDGDVDITRTTISGNQGGSSDSGNGGGIHHAGGELLQIVDCIISDNQVRGVGGGVFASSPLRIVDTTISGNRALGGGGILSKTKRTLKIEGSTISGNGSSVSGGGIAVDVGDLRLVNSTVENNTSRNGAGIATDEGDLVVHGSTISGNIASAAGGGIYNRFERTIELDNSQVIDNRAETFGGGIYGAKRLALTNGSVVSGNEPDQCDRERC